MEVEELQAILEEKDAGAKNNEVVEEEEEIIYTTEEDSEEIEEIVEIIEEIEYVDGEECPEDEIEGETEYVTEILEEEREEPVTNKSQTNNDFDSIEAMVELMDSHDDVSVTQQIQNEKAKEIKLDDDNNSSKYQSVMSYDDSADWQEKERNDPLQEQLTIMENGYNTTTKVYRSAKSKNIVVHERQMQVPRHNDDDDDIEEIEDDNEKELQTILEDDEEEEEEDKSPHEIVKNAENNLVYTVLGTSKKKNDTKHNNEESNPQYVKMERLDEGTVPVEGTIYYEGDDMGTLYVAHPYNDNEQYFDEQTLDNDEQQQQQQQQIDNQNDQQQWEESNIIVGEEPEQEQIEEEERVENQIFLHQDDEDNLYYKDENGKMQLVYLTEDGNYAFQTSGDEQETSQSNADDSMMIQEYETSPNRQLSPEQNQNSNDMDNENDTVTISLIISEDENGLKRTQVIIPTNDSLKCDICQKTFKTQSQLLKHNRLKHAREEDITVRNFPCDLCPKKFPDQNSLAKHRKIHIGDRPFSCLDCHKQFASADILRRHMADHNPNSKPLPCIYCARRFADKDTLDKHERSHTANESKTHNCDICPKSFVSATDLALHKKNHDPDKKFDCEVCGREFNRLNNLQRHMLVHQQSTRGKQPSQSTKDQEILSCDVCGITYKFMSSLTRHMVTSHVNPERMRQQAEEQRRKRENNYKRYLENRKMYETQNGPVYGKRSYQNMSEYDDEDDEDYEMA